MASDHLLFTDDGCEPFLLDELQRASSDGSHAIYQENWVRTNAALVSPLAFCRQALPNAQIIEAASINAWAELLFQAAVSTLAEGRPWLLEIVPSYGQGPAGENRCQLIKTSFEERLRKKRRLLLRSLRDSTSHPFQSDALSPSDALSMVQLYLVAPEKGILSLAPAPLPFECRHNAWPFPKGEVPIATDKSAPSRAFAKLVEAEQRLGRRIEKDDSVVDLGACPGSWSYVAIQRGARVTSVDRSPVRDDLMRHPRLTFVQGDAFKYQPSQTVDWLVCDVIAAPDRSMELLLHWLRHRLCRHFIVSIKFRGSGEYAKIDLLKKELPDLCADFYLTRLCANKNEVCAFGFR